MSDSLDFLFDGDPGAEPIIIDRSTLEHFAGDDACPARGHLTIKGKAMRDSRDTLSGSACHTIIAEAVRSVADGDDGGVADLRDMIRQSAQHARPDVQPHVIDGIVRSAYPIAQWLLYHPHGEPRHPNDLLRFEGGEGERNSQLAFDIDDHDGRPVRLTCEVDLIMATDSPEVLDVWDWKTGQKCWSPTDIKQSFQFGAFYPLVVFVNYPAVQTVRVNVWNTRSNSKAGRVEFRRDWCFADMYARLQEGVKAYLAHHDNPDAPAWPAPDKCALCDVVSFCPEAKGPPRDLATDPAAFVRQLVVKQNELDAMKKLATKYVKENGDIDAGDGLRYGLDYEAARRPSARTYKVGSDSDD